MSGEDESDSKCRLARRRRMETSSNAMFSDSPSPSREISHRERKRLETCKSEIPVVEKRNLINSSDPHTVTPTSFSFSGSSSSSCETLVVNTPIAFGSVSLTGRAREMEDAISVRPGFLQFPDSGFPLHFFGVFDGHGGSHVSALCKDRMHSLLAEELMRLPEPDELVGTEETRLRSAVQRCFLRMDQLVLSSCACGRFGEPVCHCDRSGIESEIVGSTAVIAVVGGGRVIVANCGDSRAVLSRGGRTVPLSIDHKPDRADELARIEAAGGRVIFVNGARVQGILAMSRALGDKYLKPVVISTPEIVISEITPEDECLILASDGLWDVIPNELACNVARRCLAERRSSKAPEKDPNTLPSASKGPSSHEKAEAAPDAWCSMAAALLARLALGRRSSDNISVIVVDLRRL